MDPDQPRDPSSGSPPDSPIDPTGPDGAIDAHDEQVLSDLASLYDRLDGVPDGLVARARFAVALEEVEVEVARLLGTDHERDLAGVRGDDTAALPATMTFTASGISVTLAVAEVGRDRFRVDGWLTGEDEVEVVLRHPSGTRRDRADDGRFVFDDVPAGMVQVVVAAGTDDGPTVVTPVFQL